MERRSVSARQAKLMTYVIVCLIWPCTIMCQEKNYEGIQFNSQLSWQQIIRKAKTEGKYIFIDCYATWCAPCKLMDREVFTKKVVGEFMNEKFVSARVQIDSTDGDSAWIKQWYATASYFRNEYEIKSFPTFLFFTPEGKLVHRFTHAVPDSLFIKVAAQALDSNKQYYTLQERYRRGVKSDSALRYLSIMAKDVDRSFADLVARDYLTNYLNKKPVDALLSKRDIEYVNIHFLHLLSPTDKIFQFILREGDRVNKFMNDPSLSQFVVNNVIINKEINPVISSGHANNEDWNLLRKKLVTKYGSKYADKAIYTAQKGHYYQIKDWNKLANASLLLAEKFGYDTSDVGLAFTNNMIWQFVFEHCSDPDYLQRALIIQAKIISQKPGDPEYIDTYANLLYKLGRTSEAIEWQQKAVDVSNDSSLRSNLKKMTDGQPTWPVDEESSVSKRTIDTTDFGKWPRADNAMISPDGNYIVYSVRNDLYPNNTMIVTSTKSSWKFKLAGANAVAPSPFSFDSRKMVFLKSSDSLGILSLGDTAITYIPGIISFKFSGDVERPTVAFKEKNAPNRLTILELATGVRHEFNDIDFYQFTPDGSECLIVKSGSSDNSLHQILQRVNLSTYSVQKIWRNAADQKMAEQNIIVDKNGKHIAFTVNDRVGCSLWLYTPEGSGAVRIQDDKELRKKGLKFGRLLFFNDASTSIILDLVKLEVPAPVHTHVSMDVWSYKDLKLQSQQLKELKKTTIFNAIFHIKGKKLIQIENESDHILQSLRNFNNPYILIIRNNGGDPSNESNWNKNASVSILLKSLDDGSCRLISDKVFDTKYESLTYSHNLSPLGKYVVYFDAKSQNYFSYNTKSGIRRNLTQHLKVKWTTFINYDIPVASSLPIGYAGEGWMENDEAVLVYDQNNIFKLDPEGKIPPLKLTKSLSGDDVVFRVSIMHYWKIYKTHDTLLLSAFSRKTKENGFYSVNLDASTQLDSLTLQSAILEGSYEIDQADVVPPVKARNAKAYVVRRMTAGESPNFYFTSDFRNFRRLSDVAPEKHVNWLTTELVSWETPLGNSADGVLYKPENFDSSKKYPLIIYYYERLASGLNGFIHPAQTTGSLNISYYVSNGYLVFTPDIYYQIGSPGKSALATVESAAEHLAKNRWVDKTRIGIQGHSRGGYQTNYIIAHSKKFAAAMSAAGFSNFISLNGGVRDDGGGRASGFEMYYQRIGRSLWEVPGLFIENSPIFKANKVSTPLLMMNNIDDWDIPFEQGVEFFTALRRLQKKVWMLQYDGQAHTLEADSKADSDLGVRMKQFFDHYLKDAPAPKWMTKGIPARLKGTETGYTLDPSGNCGKDCKVCNSWNEKWDKDSTAVKEEIKQWEKF